MANNRNGKEILVFADWKEVRTPTRIGILTAQLTRGHEIFSFEYDKNWIHTKFAILLDPELQLYSGPQYPSPGKTNFGIFTDSAPDRWGRVLMQRREAMFARQAERRAR